MLPGWKTQVTIEFKNHKPLLFWMSKPVSIYVDCFGTEKVPREKIIEAIKNNFDLSLAWIIKKLDLKKSIYKKTTSYGHYGRDDVNWEKLDLVEIFKKLLK